MSHACHETTYFKRIYLFPRLIPGVWSGGTFQQSFSLSMRRCGRGAHAQTSWLMGARTMCKSGGKELYETLIFKIQTARRVRPYTTRHDYSSPCVTRLAPILRFPPSVSHDRHIPSISQVPLVVPQVPQHRRPTSQTRAASKSPLIHVGYASHDSGLSLDHALSGDIQDHSRMFFHLLLLREYLPSIPYLPVLPHHWASPHSTRPRFPCARHRISRNDSVNFQHFGTPLHIVYIAMRSCRRQTSHSLSLSFLLYPSNS